MSAMTSKGAQQGDPQMFSQREHPLHFIDCWTAYLSVYLNFPGTFKLKELVH